MDAKVFISEDEGTRKKPSDYKPVQRAKKAMRDRKNPSMLAAKDLALIKNKMGRKISTDVR
jgi:hypothetical protein